jgi:hypothetical protein
MRHFEFVVKPSVTDRELRIWALVCAEEAFVQNHYAFAVVGGTEILVYTQ